MYCNLTCTSERTKAYSQLVHLLASKYTEYHHLLRLCIHCRLFNDLRDKLHATQKCRFGGAALNVLVQLLKVGVMSRWKHLSVGFRLCLCRGFLAQSKESTIRMVMQYRGGISYGTAECKWGNITHCCGCLWSVCSLISGWTTRRGTGRTSYVVWLSCIFWVLAYAVYANQLGEIVVIRRSVFKHCHMYGAFLQDGVNTGRTVVCLSNILDAQYC
jgi:hypothetical protein